MSENEETVEVKFITKILDPHLKVTEKPIRIPIQLGRYGLSGLINHLLALESPKPFDFLVESEFLRTTLEEHIKEKQISKENTIFIEYLEAISDPQHVSTFQHDDWVSCIETLITKRNFLSGCYDNIIRVWNMESQPTGVVNTATEVKDSLISCVGHTNAITGISSFLEGSKEIGFISSSKDATLRVWTANLEEKTSVNTHICKGHFASVESVDVSPTSMMVAGGEVQSVINFCSGSWDHSVRLWRIDQSAAPLFGVQKGSSKKRKTQVEEVECFGMLTGHTDNVSSVSWIDPNEIITGSWDHTVRMWDVSKQTAVTVLNGSTSLHCLSYSPFHRLVLSGHSDAKLRTWDIRSKENTIVAQIYSSHKGFVSSVAWHPTQEYLFLSAGHDNTVKMWDLRSKIPLSTLKQHNDKVLACKWFAKGNGEELAILSGGADSKVFQWSVTPQESS